MPSFKTSSQNFAPSPDSNDGIQQGEVQG